MRRRHPSRLFAAFTLVLICLAAITSAAIALFLSSTSVGWAKGRTMLVVDQSSGPLSTIQEALDAASKIPQPEGVDILVAPGTYRERLIIDRPNTSIIALSRRQYDVIVENVEPLSYLDQVVLVTASRVRVEGFRIVRTGGGTPYAAAIRVSGHAYSGHHWRDQGEEILEEVVICNNLLEASPGNGIAVHQADVEVLKNISVDPGLFGVIATGGNEALGPTPHVEISENAFANKQVSVRLIAAVWQAVPGDGPSSLTGDVRANVIMDSSWANVRATFRGESGFSPDEQASLYLTVRDNLLGAPRPWGVDLSIDAGGQSSDDSVQPGKMAIQWAGNDAGAFPPREFMMETSFAAFGIPDLGYVRDSMILVVDADGSLEDRILDLGPPDNGNRFVHLP